MNTHQISQTAYTLDQISELSRPGVHLTLADSVARNIQSGAEFIQRISHTDQPVYGVNVGFGSLCNTRVSAEHLSELQHRQLVSHACGVGDPIPKALARTMMFIKLLTFRTGHCGITLGVVQRMIDFLNADVIPVIPKKGTVGASGDLAPLAHMALPVIGLGKMHLNGDIVDTPTALASIGLKPLRLAPKEGLALTNGIQYLDAIAVHCVRELSSLAKSADLIAALSMQGFSTANTFYQRKLHALSKHEHRSLVATNLTTLLEGSNHFDLPQCDPPKEDPYSFRCVPQVHAAVRQALDHARSVVEDDCNSVSDNPLFFADSHEVLTCGNLHGASAAMVMDQVAISATTLSNISERRTYQLLSGQHGLPPFLIRNAGLNSGLMIPQYTSAALLNESKVLATPASIDTIPTCQLQEDHVSMGGTSGYKLQQITTNTGYILAIELLTAMQAIDLNEGLELSPLTREVHAAFREVVPPLEDDREQHLDIERAYDFLCEHHHAWSSRLH